jgi:hypothetical protein
MARAKSPSVAVVVGGGTPRRSHHADLHLLWTAGLRPVHSGGCEGMHQVVGQGAEGGDADTKMDPVQAQRLEMPRSTRSGRAWSCTASNMVTKSNCSEPSSVAA